MSWYFTIKTFVIFLKKIVIFICNFIFIIFFICLPKLYLFIVVEMFVSPKNIFIYLFGVNLPLVFHCISS